MLHSKQCKGALNEKAAENRITQSAFITLSTWMSFLFLTSPSFFKTQLSHSSHHVFRKVPLSSLLSQLSKQTFILVFATFRITCLFAISLDFQVSERWWYVGGEVSGVITYYLLLFSHHRHQLFLDLSKLSIWSYTRTNKWEGKNWQNNEVGWSRGRFVKKHSSAYNCFSAPRQTVGTLNLHPATDSDSLPKCTNHLLP